MARKRMIDPSIWTDDGMAELPPRQQLLYIGMFSNADDAGRLKASPVAVRLMLPCVYGGIDLEEIQHDIDAVVASMRKTRLYVVDGRPYIVFDNYPSWQRIDKPGPSLLPAPPDLSSLESAPIADQSPNDLGTVAEQSDSGSGSLVSGRELNSYDGGEYDENCICKPKTHQSANDPGSIVDPSANDPGSISPNRIERNRREEKGNTRARAAPSATWQLVEDFCDVIGVDTQDLGGEKGKQGKMASNLLSKHPHEVIIGCARWLWSDPFWHAKGIDLFTVNDQMAKYLGKGKPATAETPARASPGDTPAYTPRHLRQQRQEQSA